MWCIFVAVPCGCADVRICCISASRGGEAPLPGLPPLPPSAQATPCRPPVWDDCRLCPNRFCCPPPPPHRPPTALHPPARLGNPPSNHQQPPLQPVSKPPFSAPPPHAQSCLRTGPDNRAGAYSISPRRAPAPDPHARPNPIGDQSPGGGGWGLSSNATAHATPGLIAAAAGEHTAHVVRWN